MGVVRKPAVAGLFYPAEPGPLREAVRGYLREGSERIPRADEDSYARPRALVAPHAEYDYSGPVAGSAYAFLAGSGSSPSRVVLLGPAHHVFVDGLAVPTASAFRTPLGDVPVDEAGVSLLLERRAVVAKDAAHAPEHALEVQLPFLQEALGSGFSIVPLAVGEASDQEVLRVLEALWEEPGTLVVVSTDLSHHFSYERAATRDARTATSIEALDADRIGPGDACGRVPLRGLLRSARLRGLSCRVLDLRSSGDTAGPRDRVVGYGAFAFVPGGPS